MFHIVSTNEVLEHAPSIDAALAEIYRALRPGGWHIGTAPFAMGQHEFIRKAKLEGGNVTHLTEPEYHGNPVDERGSLVFEIPGVGHFGQSKSRRISAMPMSNMSCRRITRASVATRVASS